MTIDTGSQNVSTSSRLNVSDLQTPALIVDMDIMEQNIKDVQAKCDSLGLAFRPHVKTHKIPAIARLQMDAGAVGIAAQKVTEAKVFADAGFNDIQIPYNIVGPQKTRALVELALYNRVTVTVDHLRVVEGIADAAKDQDMSIRVLIELETPAKRTGTQPENVVAIARKVEAAENLHFAGIMAYPGDIHARPVIQEALALLDKAGIGVDIISGGGTGAAIFAEEVPELTEMRAGTYVFNDWRTVCREWATLDQCALKVAATVVSTPGIDRCILDAGSKSLTMDREDGIFGYIVEYPEAKIYKVAEEHAFVDLSECENRPVIGERVHVIPVHVCPTVNLHDQVYGYRGDTVEAFWPVAARGHVW